MCFPVHLHQFQGIARSAAFRLVRKATKTCTMKNKEYTYLLIYIYTLNMYIYIYMQHSPHKKKRLKKTWPTPPPTHYHFKACLVSICSTYLSDAAYPPHRLQRGLFGHASSHISSSTITTMRFQSLRLQTRHFFDTDPKQCTTACWWFRNLAITSWGW